MMYYDHAMVGAAIAVAVGAHRRHGWPIVVMAATAAMLPDWDDLSRGFGPEVRRAVHRVWGHNLLIGLSSGGLFGALFYLFCRAARSRWVPQAGKPLDAEQAAWGAWVAVGVLAAAGHLLADVIWSADRVGSPWPVALLWPFSRAGLALPALTTEDRVATVLLAVGLAAVCCRPAGARLLAGLTVAAVAAYGALRAVLAI